MKSKIEDKEEEVINLLKEGKSYYEMGEILGFSSSALNAYINRHGLSKYRPEVQRIDWEENKDELWKLYFEDKLSQAEIGKLFGVSQRTIGYKLEKFGFIDNSKKPKRKYKKTIPNNSIKERICPSCGNPFTPKDKGQIYCSHECSHSAQRMVPVKEEIIKTLEGNNWNYSKTGKDFGVSGNAIKKWAIKFGIYKPKLLDWSDVVNLETAQFKIDELKLRTANEVQINYPGLYDKFRKMKITGLLKYPGTEFDSSWEEDMFNLIKDNISYTSLDHNIIIDQECKYIKPLVFDIVIEYSNSSKVVVEIQGPTHFKTIYSDDKLSTTIKRDEIKYQYCLDHGIDLYYFTYESKLLDLYGYPHYVYTDENLLLEKLKSYSF